MTYTLQFLPEVEEDVINGYAWNCRHIDNAEMKPLIRAVCIKKGYQYPEICTPLELMGDHDD